MKLNLILSAVALLAPAVYGECRGVGKGGGCPADVSYMLLSELEIHTNSKHRKLPLL